MLFSPGLLIIGEACSVRFGRFFHIFCCDCCCSALEQQTHCLFLEKSLKCYFWHLYFLQMVNTIAVIGVNSALSQLTALPLLTGGGGWAGTRTGQDTRLESCSWRAESSAKVTDSPAINCISSALQRLSLSSSWANSTTCKYCKKLKSWKALVKTHFRCVHLPTWWNSFCISQSWRSSPDQSE